jgi:hypothetical protein
MEKKVSVHQVKGDLYITGKVVDVITAGVNMSFDTILKYYFNGDKEKMLNSSRVPAIYLAKRYDRVVIEKKNGSYYIVPFNQNFEYVELEEE